MDATEQFAAFALMGLLANGSHHPKTVVDRAWELGRDMELKAMEHRRAMRAAAQAAGEVAAMRETGDDK